MIDGNKAQVFHWKGFGFKLHVPSNAFQSRVSNCIVNVKAFLPTNYLELPENTELVSAIYHISISSSITLSKGVEIEIEHCCKLVKGNREKLEFVTSTSAQWSTPSFFYLDGGHFHNGDTYGKILLHHFSWFATVRQRIKSLFSQPVTYCIKVYQQSVSPTTKYIHFILIKNLAVHLQVIKHLL